MTLYYWAKDVNGTSNATGAVIQTWPIFNAAAFTIPSSLNAADFATITRSDGKSQSTYKGFPLYYYSGDKVSGDTAGNGISGVWFIIQTANFPRTPSPTPASGGGYHGY